MCQEGHYKKKKQKKNIGLFHNASKVANSPGGLPSDGSSSKGWQHSHNCRPLLTGPLPWQCRRCVPGFSIDHFGQDHIRHFADSTVLMSHIFI